MDKEDEDLSDDLSGNSEEEADFILYRNDQRHCEIFDFLGRGNARNVSEFGSALPTGELGNVYRFWTRDNPNTGLGVTFKMFIAAFNKHVPIEDLKVVDRTDDGGFVLEGILRSED